MSKFVVMSSSDSEKTTSNQFHTSDNAQSSSSSSPSNSNTIIDLELTETSRDNPVDIIDISKKGKEIKKSRKPRMSRKYLKVYDSRYQEWVDAGSSPSTSSGRKYNPQIKNAPYACKTGACQRLGPTSLMTSKKLILGS